MKQVAVSAVVPTFNRASYLSQSIEAILGGIVVPAEILVVDDGSTDHTAQVVGGFGDRVRYVRQPNSGKAAALNKALDLTTQPFVWIMDDDDVVRRDGLERLYQALSTTSDVGFSYGGYAIFRDDASTVESREVLTPNPSAESLHLDQLEGSSIFQPAMLVRRGCYEQVGPFDTTLLRSQDYDMLLRLTHHFQAVDAKALIFDQRQHDTPRGTATLQSNTRTSIELWREYNQRIFRRIYNDYHLDDYLVAGNATGVDRHRALVRRAALMGRHGLWERGLNDLRHAADCIEQSVTSADVELFRRSLSHRVPGEAGAPLREVRAIVRTFDVASRSVLLPIVQACQKANVREVLKQLIDWVPGAYRVARLLKEKLS